MIINNLVNFAGTEYEKHIGAIHGHIICILFPYGSDKAAIDLNEKYKKLVTDFEAAGFPRVPTMGAVVEPLPRLNNPNRYITQLGKFLVQVEESRTAINIVENAGLNMPRIC